MKNLKKIVAGGLMALSLCATVLPVNSFAGVIADGVKASGAEVKSDSKGNYAYGFVEMDKYHTTTTKLYHYSEEVKSAANTGTGRVSATTGYYTNYGTNLSARVFYK